VYRSCQSVDENNLHTELGRVSGPSSLLSLSYPDSSFVAQPRLDIEVLVNDIQNFLSFDFGLLFVLFIGYHIQFPWPLPLSLGPCLASSSSKAAIKSSGSAEMSFKSWLIASGRGVG